ncbi:MAG: TolC family protein [Gemmatimonadaceae bacterium]|nr:TolC family protein [Gemmatimonadaceae bacterium]
MKAVAFAFIVTVLGATAGAQSPASVTLADLQRAAIARDARAAQRDLLREAADLRIRSIRNTLLPRFTVSASNSHASDVTHLNLALPGGAPVPIPPRDRWSGAVDVAQVVYDGGAASRAEAVEAARLSENVAGVDAALEPLRAEVTGAFFATALMRATESELSAAVSDLETVLAETRARVREGAALGRDSASVRAEWRGAQARLAQARSSRRAAMANLERLTGVALPESTSLTLPDWGARLAALDSAGGAANLRERPEFTQVARTRARLDTERGLAAVENRPRVLAFLDGGYGRPGLNQFESDPARFWQAGIKVEWAPFTWGSSQRNEELAALQQKVLLTEERALADRLARAVQGDIENRARLAAQLRDDDEVIALRADALAQGEAQRREGVITAAEAVGLRSALTDARLARERHRIELAQAEANIATTLGLTPR